MIPAPRESNSFRFPTAGRFSAPGESIMINRLIVPPGGLAAGPSRSAFHRSPGIRRTRERADFSSARLPSGAVCALPRSLICVCRGTCLFRVSYNSDVSRRWRASFSFATDTVPRAQPLALSLSLPLRIYTYINKRGRLFICTRHSFRTGAFCAAVEFQREKKKRVTTRLPSSRALSICLRPVQIKVACWNQK